MWLFFSMHRATFAAEDATREGHSEISFHSISAISAKKNTMCSSQLLVAPNDLGEPHQEDTGRRIVMFHHPVQDAFLHAKNPMQ
jgi:hypothetical protein